MSTDAKSVRCLFIQGADKARLSMISEDLVPRPQVVSSILKQYYIVWAIRQTLLYTAWACCYPTA